jgi:hypothetical protein
MMAHNGVISTAFFLAAFTAYGRSPQNVVKEVAVIVDYVEAPTTLEDAIARAQAVVRARILGAQFRTPRDKSGSDVRTAYKLDIVEVLKQDLQLPPATEVLRTGGDKGTRRFVEDGFHYSSRNKSTCCFWPGIATSAHMRWLLDPTLHFRWRPTAGFTDLDAAYSPSNRPIYLLPTWEL